MWTSLSLPCKFLALDFHNSAANMDSFACPLSFQVNKNGICNGMAFWFDLHLDEQVTLTSSPFSKQVSNN